MSSHVRARRRRQLPDAGGYPSLFTALSTLPCLYPRSLSVPSPPPRVSLTHLIYYSRSGCFINCLSLRIKLSWTRVGGTRRRALISSIASFLPFPLSPRVLARCSHIHTFASLSFYLYPSPLIVSLLAQYLHATRYLHAMSVSSSRCLITSRPISVPYPCLHRKSREPTVACLKFFLLVTRLH